MYCLLDLDLEIDFDCCDTDLDLDIDFDCELEGLLSLDLLKWPFLDKILGIFGSSPSIPLTIAVVM